MGARLRSVLGLVLWAAAAAPAGAAERPNFVVVFADDLGYGDLGSFGHPVIRTPNLDRLAAEGQRWTSFYVASSVCTPSRAALLTGRYPVRSGMASSRRRVLFPDSGGGLPDDEVTIAEALAPAGYVSAAIGKWHLGHMPRFLPTRQGFSSYWGIPYSNDMDKAGGPDYRKEAEADPGFEADPAHYRVPVLDGQREVERPADQRSLTRRYTERAIAFIRENRERPFFLYLAHSMVHIPLFTSDEFRGRSPAGPYGDAVEEIDAGVGRIVESLRELGLDRRTVLVFTSDNGPWREFGTHGGSAGPLRGGKGDTFEGGMREPTVVWGPGLVRPGVVRDMGSTLDLLPTLCSLAGVPVPAGRVLDGYDLGPVLRAEGPSPRAEMLFYRDEEVYAARLGPWKAHFVTRSGYGPDLPAPHSPPLLYNLDQDPSERFDVAARHPDVVRRIREHVEAHRRTFVPVANQLDVPLTPTPQ
jgi:arylsulfatase A-like enzyme